MRTFKPYIILLILLPLTAGCEKLEKLKNINIKMPKLYPTNIQKTITETKTVAISCNKGNIEVYKDQGWKVKDTKTQEVVCSWKTKRAKRGCNIDKDKGCKITVPDVTGEQVIYYLERQKEIND